jgi:hypothetical protein
MCASNDDVGRAERDDDRQKHSNDEAHVRPIVARKQLSGYQAVAFHYQPPVEVAG